MAAEQVIQIPYKPRELQRVVGRAMRKARFGVLVCHRRFGKTVLGVNLLQQAALTSTLERPRCGYLGPTYTQGKAVAWDYMQHYAKPIPGVAFNQSELRVDFPNKGQSRIYGADNPDSLRGLYFDWVVPDEFGLHPPKTFSEVIGPTLVDRGGKALLLGTPAGKNQFYDMAERAKAEVAAGNPDWFYGAYKASQTGLLSPAYLASQRALMTDDEYAQEFECSFEASVKGAYYSAEMEAARLDGRIGKVPYDPALPVDTDWDLGMDDQTAIWFTQTPKGSPEVRVIDYHETSGEGLPQLARTLEQKRYTYGTHWAPHDIVVRELGSGKSRQEVARDLGIRFEVTPRIAQGVNEIAEGIHAVRLLLPRCWFDSGKCQPGIEALKHYRKDYNSRLNEFKGIPVHDWASHGADAFRGLAARHQIRREQLAEAPFRFREASPLSWLGN